MSSKPVTECQSCFSRELESVLWLGCLPLVNDYAPIGEPARPQTNYPLELLRCAKCELVQLGIIVGREELFPESYPYTSGTTKALRDNFADLATKASMNVSFGEPLVIDIGSNDGTLLRAFKERGWRVQGITPESVGIIANAIGIPTHIGYFGIESANAVVAKCGQANLVTATNVFAHVDNPHSFIDDVLRMLAPGGRFVTESHYLGSLIEGTQFDAVYAEHMRYYSLKSITTLLNAHDLVVFEAERIPSHGGSIRVYAGRAGEYKKAELEEPLDCSREALETFALDTAATKSELWEKLLDAGDVLGIGAPSRASTLLSYCGITETSLPAVYEASGSHKIGKYMPGSHIEVRAERDQFDSVAGPDTLFLLSHHIAEELKPKLRAKGFDGQFLIPLPRPRLEQ